jgi:hypothetical protein
MLNTCGSQREHSWITHVARFSLLFLVVAMTSGGTPASAAGESGEGATVHVWKRWDQAFTAANNYANPYEDVELVVRFTSPDLTVSEVRGFWDGSRTWRVRFAFPSAGHWSYVTECSNPNDTGLHGRTGAVLVAHYIGANPLYSFGFPRPSSSGRTFVHRNGTPFFYLADTAWEPWIYLSTDEWTEYVSDRAAKGFSVIQSANGFDPWWELWEDGGCSDSATDGIPPWHGEIGMAERYNPSHFQQIDQFVELANQQGLVMSLMGIMNAGDHDLIDEETRRRFEQTLAARFQGNAVILSPSVDDPWAWINITRDAGSELRERDDSHYRQMLTYHIGTYAHGCDEPYEPGNYSCHLHADTWVDLNGYQSGHNKSQVDRMIYWAVRRAYEMPLYFYGLNPPKPAVNLEPLYETPIDWFPPGNDLDDLEYRCRQIGWYTYLSGGAGHTYGVHGIWDFGRFNEPQCGPPAANWQVAIDNSFSRQAEYTGRFFRELKWWRLEPRHDLIEDQVSDPKKRKVLTLADDNSFLVAYVPRTHDDIVIDLREMADNGISLWYDPRSAVYSHGPPWSAGDPDASFPTPDADEDWVLLLMAVGDIAVDEEHGKLPRARTVLQASPNPFRGSTSISFALPTPGTVRLSVYDTSGRLVKVLLDREVEGGQWKGEWNGAGIRKETRAGVYVMRLEAAGHVHSTKVVQLP